MLTDELQAGEAAPGAATSKGPKGAEPSDDTRSRGASGILPARHLGETELIWLMALLMALQAFGIDAILPALDELALDLGVPGNDRQFVIGVYLLTAGIGALVPGDGDQARRCRELFAPGLFPVAGIAHQYEGIVAIGIEAGGGQGIADRICIGGRLARYPCDRNSRMAQAR